MGGRNILPASLAEYGDCAAGGAAAGDTAGVYVDTTHTILNCPSRPLLKFMDNSTSMLQDQKFSVRGRLKSFYYAGAGLKQFFRQEHNARIHLVAAIVVSILAWRLTVSHME